MRPFFIILVLLVMAFLQVWADSPQYSVTDLGTLGGTESSVAGLNKNGQVVGSSSTSNGVTHAFLYTGGKMTDLGTLGGTGSYACGINNQGQVVGASYTSNGVLHAFLYTGTHMIDLDTLNSLYSVAYCVNDNGQAAGVALTNQSSYNGAFLFYGGTMTSLGTLGGAASRAYGINNNGQIVGSAETNGLQNMHPFVYSGGVMTDLGSLGQDAEAFGLNSRGQVVGYCFMPDGARDAFLYSEGTMIDLGIPGGNYSQARGINENGDVVGLANTASHPYVFGFLYSGGTIRNLNDLVAGSGWTLQDAMAINDNGQIIGDGVNPSGQSRSVLLTPLPRLHIEFNAGLIISWPTNAGGCALYHSPDGTATAWMPVTNAPTVTNGQYQVGISDLSANQQFYRLICH